MQEMGQMFGYAEIIDKTSKKKLRLENPLQNGTWSRILQKPESTQEHQTIAERPPKTRIFGPFQDHPNPPKGECLEKL